MFDFLESIVESALDGVIVGIEFTGRTIVSGIDALEDGIDYVRENPGKSAAVAGAAVGTVFAAPIAATIGASGLLGTTAGGTAISTLSGAALQSASLAALGGGSLAAGGAGMAGGTVVVAATSGTVSAAAGKAIS